MNVRKLIISFTVLAICFSLTMTSAWAGRRRHSRSDDVTVRIGIDFGYRGSAKPWYSHRPYVRRGYHLRPIYYSPVAAYFSAPRVFYASPYDRWNGPRHYPKGHWKKRHRHRHGRWCD